MAEQFAVLFDWTTFRVWLEQPSNGEGTPTNRQRVDALNTAYQPLDSEAGWLVELTLATLRTASLGDGVPAPWAYGPGVENVKVRAVVGAEGGTDGVFGEVTVDGVCLSIGHLGDKELMPVDRAVMPGYEAAEVALTVLAERVNAVAERFRGTRPVVVDAEIIE